MASNGLHGFHFKQLVELKFLSVLLLIEPSSCKSSKSVRLKAPRQAVFPEISQQEHVSPFHSPARCADAMATRNTRAALAFQSPCWPRGYPSYLENGPDSPQRNASEVRKAVQARGCLHAAALHKKCRAGLHAGPAATGDHRAAWSMGLLRLSEPEQMFIQELREAEIGPWRAAQRTHSLTFHQQHSKHPGAASVTEGL